MTEHTDVFAELMLDRRERRRARDIFADVTEENTRLKNQLGSLLSWVDEYLDPKTGPEATKRRNLTAAGDLARLTLAKYDYREVDNTGDYVDA